MVYFLCGLSSARGNSGTYRFLGAGSSGRRKKLWHVFEKIGLHKEAPIFPINLDSIEWVSIEDPPKPLTKLKYKACPVIELKNAQKVDEIVIRLRIPRPSGH
jgi:hypothetical protein